MLPLALAFVGDCSYVWSQQTAEIYPSHSNTRPHSATTYKTCRLWCLHWQTIWLHRSPGTRRLGFAVLALDLLFFLSAICFYTSNYLPSLSSSPLTRGISADLRCKKKKERSSVDRPGAYRPPRHLLPLFSLYYSPKRMNSPSSS